MDRLKKVRRRIFAFALSCLITDRYGTGALSVLVQTGNISKQPTERAKGVKKISIGIDPGKTTGIAIAENGVLQSLESTDFWGAFYTVKHFVEMCRYNADFHKEILVMIEVPTTKANWHGAGASHNVGRVCRESELLAEGIKRLGATVVTQHPQGKLNQKQFSRITGWTKRTNQHCRDAAVLVYGANNETR